MSRPAWRCSSPWAGTGYAADTLPANSVGQREIKTGGVDHGRSPRTACASGRSPPTPSARRRSPRPPLAGETLTTDRRLGELRPGTPSARPRSPTASIDASRPLDHGQDGAVRSAAPRSPAPGTSAGGNATSVDARRHRAPTPVTFDHDVGACQIAATLAAVPTRRDATDTPDPGEPSPPARAPSANQVAVTTYFGDNAHDAGGRPTSRSTSLASLTALTWVDPQVARGLAGSRGRAGRRPTHRAGRARCRARPSRIQSSTGTLAPALTPASTPAGPVGVHDDDRPGAVADVPG